MALFSGVFLLFAKIANAADTYLWPLRIDPELTSKFCDYRGGHFHGGLDIRTQGRTGLQCYAIDDGYIYRATTSFRGFGRALYLKLKDSRIVVYGHLSAFDSAVAQRIRAGQMKDKKYDQDLYFTSSEFPVKRGDKVALSGSAGVGAPHLHLELRSPDNNPLNPLEFGYNLADKGRTEFHWLAIRHYKYNFNPGNPCQTELIPLTGKKLAGGYVLTDTVISNGYVALAIAGGDRISGPGFLYGFYGLNIRLNDSLIFQMNSDSLSFNTTGQLTYVRDLELIRMFSGRKKLDNDENIFYRLYAPTRANQYFWHGFADGAGIIPPDSLAGHVRKVEIVGFDERRNETSLKFYIRTPELPEPIVAGFHGNANSRTIEFKTKLNPVSVSLQYRKSSLDQFRNIKAGGISKALAGDGENSGLYSFIFVSEGNDADYRFRYNDAIGDISAWSYLHDNASSDEKLIISGTPDFLEMEYYSHAKAIPITLNIQNGTKSASAIMAPNGQGSYKTDLIKTNFSGLTKLIFKNAGMIIFDTTFNLYPVLPEKASVAYSPDSTLNISFGQNSAYYPAFIFPSNSVKTVLFNNPAIEYDLEPATFLAHSPIRFKFDIAKLGLAGKKIGVYGQTAGGGWAFIGKIDGDKLEANGNGLGKLALIEDPDPPIISKVIPASRTASQRPLLSCSISDRISGLALDDGVTMSIDGNWIPAEYDIDTGRFSYMLVSPLAFGEHNLEIRAFDNQGNLATRTTTFKIVKAAK